MWLDGASWLLCCTVAILWCAAVMVYIAINNSLALNLIFVVPCITLYSSEISPTRCNNCVLFFAMALLYMFRATISPIIRSTYAVYGHR